MKMPVVVGTNCCAANFYHNYLNTPFYSPFIWSVVPYKSIITLLNSWESIDWGDIELAPNPVRPLTVTITISNSIQIHYVHYFYSPQHNTPYSKGASIFYQHIFDYTLKKYTERVKRMLNYGEMASPVFIIHEEDYNTNQSTTDLISIMTASSNFKRYVITHTVNLSTVKRDSNCNYIFDPIKKLPEPMIMTHGNAIASFFGVEVNASHIPQPAQ